MWFEFPLTENKYINERTAPWTEYFYQNYKREIALGHLLDLHGTIIKVTVVSWSFCGALIIMWKLETTTHTEFVLLVFLLLKLLEKFYKLWKKSYKKGIWDTSFPAEFPEFEVMIWFFFPARYQLR